MADVFISCCRTDLVWARQTAERLESLGFSVALEREPAEAEHHIDEARAVISVWSNEARNSVQLCAEASQALDLGKLLQVRIDGAQPSPPFETRPAADMTGERAEWGQLEADVAKLVRGEPAEAVKPPGVGPLATASAATVKRTGRMG